MDINEIARKAWDDGFKTAVGYNDNHIFCVGEQLDPNVG